MLAWLPQAPHLGHKHQPQPPMRPQPHRNPHESPVADLHLSKEGRAFIVEREKLIALYNNDQAGNCTYGIGTLVRCSGCTKEEMAVKKIPQDEIDKAFDGETDKIEANVRDGVGKQELSQTEFDALVSLVYDAGAGGARAVLNRVKDLGPQASAALILTTRIHVTEMGKDGKNHRVVSRGLVNRRHAELALFQGRGYSILPAIKPLTHRTATKHQAKVTSYPAPRNAK